MPGSIDVFDRFPNSKMAQAVRNGESRFRRIEGVVAPGKFFPTVDGAPVIIPNTGQDFATEANLTATRSAIVGAVDNARTAIVNAVNAVGTTLTNWWAQWRDLNGVP